MARRPKRRKSRKILGQQTVEYLGVLFGIFVVRALPMAIGRFFARRVGDIFYLLFRGRRAIARRNLAVAFPELGEKQVRRVIHAACQSLFLTGLEMIKYQRIFDRPDAADLIAQKVPGFLDKLQAVRKLYAETGGFITVLPHLGNWEILLHVADLAGIPHVIVVRPLDNPRLENLLYRFRTDSKQEFVPKHNVLYTLKNALRRGKCIAMLGDQRAGHRGILAPFFGRPATTHRTPALLACRMNRPILVLAACRTKDGFEGFLSEPVWPRPDAPEEEEILRIAAAVNERMAEFIRRRPEQYLWAHDRWKDS